MHKNIKILLIILAVCIAVFGIIKIAENLKNSSNPTIKIKSGQVTNFKISSTINGNFVFKKDSGLWRVAVVSNTVTSDYYFCSQKLINDLLEKMQNVKLSDVVTENQGRWEEFEVSDLKSVKVDFRDNKGKGICFHVGKIGYDENHYYFRFEGMNEIWLSAGLQKWAVYGNLDYWRDKWIMQIDKNSIEQVEIIDYTKKPKETILLSKTSDYWVLSDKGKDNKVNKTDLMDQILNAGSSLEASYFAKPGEKIKKIWYQITIKTKNQSDTITLGDYNDYKFLITKNQDPTVYGIFDYKISCFKKSKSDFQ